MNNLALLLATSNDPKLRNSQEAVSLAEKAVEFDPDNAVYLDTLATTYFEAGKPDKAAVTEEQAVRLNSDNVSYKKAFQRYRDAAQVK